MFKIQGLKSKFFEKNNLIKQYFLRIKKLSHLLYDVCCNTTYVNIAINLYNL